MDQACIATPLGTALIQGDRHGVTAITLTEGSPAAEVPDSLKVAAQQLQEYFEGSRKAFDFPINPQGTPFQQRVWEALQDIPFGKTRSYLDLSKTLGDPKAIRAVASANGKNPLWIVIPCHRVIGSDGSMVGYAGGIHRKKWLLNHESPNPQQELF